MSFYQAYINSPMWWEKRDLALEAYGPSCEFCGEADATLHVHHLTYDRLGDEALADLCVLCGFCHADLHESPRLREQIEGVIWRRRNPPADLDDSEPEDLLRSYAIEFGRICQAYKTGVPM